MKILLAAATAAEIAPAAAWLASPATGAFHEPQHSIEICITGVGLLATTFRLTQTLSCGDYDLVIGAGIAGAFNRSLQPGDCVLVRDEQLADLGAEDGAAFLDAFDMGLLRRDEAPFTGSRLVNPMTTPPVPAAGLRSVSGLTVLRVSGHEPTIAERENRYAADIESMEGAALHYACLALDVPFIHLRAISNYVTRRDRSAWKMGEAIGALNRQLLDWLHVLLQRPI